MHPLVLGRLEVIFGDAGARSGDLELITELAGTHKHDAVG